MQPGTFPDIGIAVCGHPTCRCGFIRLGYVVWDPNSLEKLVKIYVDMQSPYGSMVNPYSIRRKADLIATIYYLTDENGDYLVDEYNNYISN